VFYLGSIAVVVTLLPYDDASVSQSPYVAVLQRIGLPAAGTVLDVIVLTAVLSCLNSGLYTASRMVFSLSSRGDAPTRWSRVSSSGVPASAVLASTVVGFVTVALNYVVPDAVFTFLLNTSAAIALLVWLAIALSHLRMRRRLEQEEPERLVLRMWGFPYLTYGAIAFIVLLMAGMLLDDSGRSQMIASLLLAAVVVGVGITRQRRSDGA
ncbi:amino acid permease, partial [Lentzea kentuckyensis]|uniref:amino acid permease n=1 Tax=Lentzea kentuckyensis TaxID=360086 RepID=UPI001FE74952